METVLEFDVIQSGLALLLFLALGDFLSTLGKGMLPSILVAGLLYTGCSWAGLVPADLFQRAGLSALSSIAMLLLILHMGASMSIKELWANWRVVALATASFVCQLIMLFLVIGGIFGLNVAVGGLPGGSAVAMIVQERARELGYDHIVVLSVLILSVQALVACPMAVGLYVLGKPIMALIFPSLNADLAGPLLSTLGLATLFVCMMLVCNSILQAHGFVNLPVAIMLMGGVVKIFTNYHVVVVPSMGIYGAPMGNILCFALCMVLDLVVIARVIPRRPSYFQVFAKPAAASALMGLGAWAVYGLMAKGLIAVGKLCEVDRATQEIVGLSRTGNGLAVICAILVAVAVYGILVIALRAITREDLSLMPKGEKIARILHLS